ncbi:hypothetical protein [Nocardioides sp. WS12]|uniref:hypothetical protein n=1 Tax=Nocardioides sp. WS12 TaxID=2486272 RepID=UPI0015F8F6E3|nr:hypothetical protein [Nocardioides sp. WS12]
MKTVAFFEVCDENDLPMLATDWQDCLGELLVRQQDNGITDLRHQILGVRNYAQVYVHNESRHLVLAREREEPPSSLDESSGDILDEETQANRPWVEISVLSFIPGTNIFGLVLGAQGSPRAGALADWVNKDGELFDDLISVRPYTDDQLVGMLQDGSSEARMVSVRLDPHQIHQGNIDPNGGLYSATQQLGRDLDLGSEIDVEVILRVRGRSSSATDSTRGRIADIGRNLIGRPIRSGQVELVDFEPESVTDRELVDLVKYRMATKETVSVMDDDGHQVRIPSAINAISRAADRLQIKAD